MLVIGLVIGVAVLLLYMPIFELAGNIQRTHLVETASLATAIFPSASLETALKAANMPIKLISSTQIKQAIIQAQTQQRCAIDVLKETNEQD